MKVEKFPSWVQDHINAISRIVYEVSKYNSKALERVLLDVKESLRVGLDNLEEESHPRVESLVEAV
jgi:hypothetical protein